MGGSSDSGNSGWGANIGGEVGGYYGQKYGGAVGGAIGREVGKEFGGIAQGAWDNSVNSGIHPDYGNYTAMGDYGGQQGQRYD